MAAAAESATPGPIPQWTQGDRLRKARETAGVTVIQMAQLLEVTDRTIRNWETDSTPVKRLYLKEWAARCGGPDVLHWIVTGEAPGIGPNSGHEQAGSSSGCSDMTARRSRQLADETTQSAPRRRAS